jgi:hypothetical protein
MLVAFGFADKSWSEIAQISDPFSKRATWLGPSSHIQWDASGAVVFGFGKHKGQQVALADGGFLRWVLAKDFPPHVQKICRIALERRGKFDEWVTTYYPRPSIIRADATCDIDDGSSETDPLAPDAVQGVLL